jgi:hypothetical protein
MPLTYIDSLNGLIRQLLTLTPSRHPVAFKSLVAEQERVLREAQIAQFPALDELKQMLTSELCKASNELASRISESGEMAILELLSVLLDSRLEIDRILAEYRIHNGNLLSAWGTRSCLHETHILRDLAIRPVDIHYLIRGSDQLKSVVGENMGKSTIVQTSVQKDLAALIAFSVNRDGTVVMPSNPKPAAILAFVMNNSNGTLASHKRMK